MNSLVIAAVTTWPPMSIRTWAVVAPFFTSTILPFNLLRALSFASRSPHCGSAGAAEAVFREHALAVGRKMNIANA